MSSSVAKRRFRGWVNSEPMIAPSGSVATRPRVSTQASVSQDATASSRRPSKRNPAGISTMNIVATDIAAWLVTLPVR